MFKPVQREVPGVVDDGSSLMGHSSDGGQSSFLAPVRSDDSSAPTAFPFVHNRTGTASNTTTPGQASQASQLMRNFNPAAPRGLMLYPKLQSLLANERPGSGVFPDAELGSVDSDERPGSCVFPYAELGNVNSDERPGSGVFPDAELGNVDSDERPGSCVFPYAGLGNADNDERPGSGVFPDAELGNEEGGSNVFHAPTGFDDEDASCISESDGFVDGES